MADYRNDDDPTLPGGPTGINRTPETDPEHLLPDHTAAPAVPGLVAGGVSGDPDAVRDEIERTRRRMSSTIDQIEGALQRKKGEIQERLDVVAPIRERPWIFAAGVFGTGLVLGLLTGGGGDDDDRDHVKVPRALLAGLNLDEGHSTGNGYSEGTGYGYAEGAGNGYSGTSEWEERSRELMQVVARQEEEIRDLRAALYDEDYAADGYSAGGYADLGADDELVGADALGDVDVADEWDEEWNYDDGRDALDDFGAFGVEGENGGFLKKAVAAAVAAGLAGVLGAAGKKIVASRGRGGEMDVEVELEPGGAVAADVQVDQDYLAARRGEGYTGEAYGEMDVEVELERPYTGAYRAQSEYVEDQPRYGRELEVEVEMERPRQYAGGWEAPRERGLPVSPLAGAVAAGAAALVGGLVARLVRNRSQEMDVEVELEERPAYRPSTAPAPRRTAAAGGEMQVEVELEERGAHGGYTSSPQPISADREYEVELERPGGASASGTTDADTTRQAQSDPPLM